MGFTQSMELNSQSSQELVHTAAVIFSLFFTGELFQTIWIILTDMLQSSGVITERRMKTVTAQQMERMLRTLLKDAAVG